MYFQHAPAIWQRFPQLVPGVLLAARIERHADPRSYIDAWYGQARRRLESQAEGQMPEVAAWRRVYSAMGLKPTQYRSASEALLRRFKREDDLPRLHPLVDLCNAASLAFALPVAVFDLGKVSKFLEVRPASGTEEYLSFQEEVEYPEPGEIIFADGQDHAHARRWTFRQGRLSVVTAETRNVLIVSEAVHDGARKDVDALLTGLRDALASLWSPPEQRAVLTAREPRFEFEL
jgi:DNA/RNA-binding domain of Phe-tRNA-synthetase-like protein